MDSSSVLYNQIKAAEPFCLLAGPDVVESEDHFFRMAKHVKAITTKLGCRWFPNQALTRLTTHPQNLFGVQA